jgi:membrane-associated protease RseP (regulator of RpoE activity)
MSSNRLHEQIACMIAVEEGVERLITQLLTNLDSQQEVAETIEGIRAVARLQKQALVERMAAIGGAVSIPEPIINSRRDDGGHPASSALQGAFVALNEAIFGYATLSLIAKRFRDSPVIGDDNTMVIADKHAQDYVAAVRSISQLLDDVVVAELDDSGNSCDCTCACCGIGLCICATYNRESMSNAWADASPYADTGELHVHRPRLGSPAADAGIQQGDNIVAADGKELSSYATLYEVADSHKSGETVNLRVRRSTGEISEVSLVIP